MGTHEIVIDNSTYYVHGNDTHTLKELCDIMKLKYDKLEKSKLSSTQKLIKVWKIGELNDYIKKIK